MLYQLYEFQRAALAPLRIAAETGQILFRHPFNPWSHSAGGRAIAALSELCEASLRRYGKPAFAHHATTINGATVRIEEATVLEHPFCRLLHFRRAGRAGDPRLLIVAPLSGHFATLLRGTVGAMLSRHDVYVTDWQDARMVPARAGGFDLDDYIDWLIAVLRHLGPGSHVMAVCQPSVPVLAASALMAAANDPAAPASLVLMGGPIDTRHNPTMPNSLAKSRSLDWFARNVIGRVPFQYPGFMRRVYPGFLQLTGFMTMNLDRHVGAHLRLFHNLVRGDGDSAAQHRKFYHEYRAVMDLPAEYYLQTVKRVFQDHDLARGRFRHRGEAVDTAAIVAPLMTVEGENDDISGLGQTRAAQDLCPHVPDDWRLHHVEPEVGHYGVFNGRRWRDSIAPRVAKFISRAERLR